MHPSATPPDGYMECNGAFLPPSSYVWLFSKIGTTYGGNGTTSFAIPDFRGEFIRGWDHGRGVDAGRGLGSFQADELKSHQHEYDEFGNNAGPYQTVAPSPGFYYNAARLLTSFFGGAETRPRNVAQMFCIAWKP
jgi:microcystin-dependent protein